MTPFAERAEEMGLTVIEGKGLYQYSDRYGQVVYRHLAPIPTPPTHQTDEHTTPLLGIYTRENSDSDFIYRGYVSDSYRFIGNDSLLDRIRAAINAVGTPILEELVTQNYEFTRLRDEMIISSSQNIQQVGDIMPVMIVDNSYNGTKAACLSFGIATRMGEQYVVFSFKLGEMRQVHIASSRTSLTSAITSYMQVFSDNIAEMITESFNSRISEEDLLRLLDVVESHGKRRREKISELLAEQTGEGENRTPPTAWQVFLAIVRYSSLEENLNIKRLLENAAESVLVIPTRMRAVMERLQS